MHEQLAGKWMVIVNPNAGKGKGKKDWKKISALLAQYNISFSNVFTRSQKHAILLTHECISQGFRHIMVVGGDGTLNEVANGILTQQTCISTDITLAMIAVGTGNDWGKMFGISADYEQAIRIIREGKARLQDAGIVEYFRGTVKENRYFINIAGLGFDAIVVQRTNLQKEKGRKGKALYFMNLLQSLMLYSHTSVEMEIDGRKIEQDVFSISIGIGRYSGGGMMQTPFAIPDDGLFDITIIKKIRKADIILSLKKLYDRSILLHPRIEGFRGKDILINSVPLIHVEADGETLGHSPIRFQIIPKSINIVYDHFPE
jgi:YegS/Rv2252/BmrU family lipid kinase